MPVGTNTLDQADDEFTPKKTPSCISVLEFVMLCKCRVYFIDYHGWGNFISND